MMNMCEFSNNTQVYLGQYQSIFNNMVKQMSSVMFTNSISGSFIMQMIPHHRAAIAMSHNLLRYTTNIPLQSIACHIIASQELSIQNMTKGYPNCRLYLNSSRELACYKNQNCRIINTMFHEMHAACADNEIDTDFMREMIPHHEGAVRMSKNALCYCVCPDLKPQLEAIIASQEEGIRQMKLLLQEADDGTKISFCNQ